MKKKRNILFSGMLLCLLAFAPIANAQGPHNESTDNRGPGKPPANGCNAGCHQLDP